MVIALTNVRFWGNSGHRGFRVSCPLLTQSGHTTFIRSPPQHGRVATAKSCCCRSCYFYYSLRVCGAPREERQSWTSGSWQSSLGLLSRSSFKTDWKPRWYVSVPAGVVGYVVARLIGWAINAHKRHSQAKQREPIREITGRLAPTLVLSAPNDLVFYEPIVRETMQKIAEAGGSVDGVPLSGPNGHLNGVFAVGQASDKITAFLTR